MNKRLWFKAKTYGWGWMPSTWEGWLVIAAYVVFLVCILRRTEDHMLSARETVLEVTLPILLITSILILISYQKGEPPRWRWGKSSDE